jgi:hypothetical protein
MTRIANDPEPKFTPCTIEIVATADLIGDGDGSRMCVTDDEGSTYAAATVVSRRQARRRIEAWSYEFPIVIADAYRRIDEHFARIAAR